MHLGMQILLPEFFTHLLLFTYLLPAYALTWVFLENKFENQDIGAFDRHDRLDVFNVHSA